MDIGDHIAGKLTSGRFILTVAVGVAFVAFSLTVCLVIALNWYRLTPGEIVGMLGTLMVVVLSVVKDYFARHRTPPPISEG